MTNVVDMRGRYSGKAIASAATSKGQDSSELDKKDFKKKASELMPRGLSADQKKVWRRLAPDMIETNRLTVFSVDAFTEYCAVKIELENLKAFLAKKGEFSYETVGRHGSQIKSYPEVAQLNQARTQFVQLCAHFGLTPATEARIREAKAGTEQNPFSAQ